MLVVYLFIFLFFCLWVVALNFVEFNTRDSYFMEDKTDLIFGDF